MGDDNYHRTRSFKPNIAPTHGLLGDVRPVGPEDPLLGLKGSISWQFAWQTAIALAWANPEQKAFLIRDPRAFFKVYANYNLPEGLKLTVAEMTPDAEGTQPGWDASTQTWYLQDTELTMYLPPAPPQDEQAVALAAYNATARAYPFTIC